MKRQFGLRRDTNKIDMDIVNKLNYFKLLTDETRPNFFERSSARSFLAQGKRYKVVCAGSSPLTIKMFNFELKLSLLYI